MKEKVLRFVFLSFVVFFFVLLIAEKTGYYESRTTKAKTLTEEQIKIFEEDIKNGKEIDVTEYTVDLNKDYSTDLSDDIYRVSLKLENIFDKSIKFIFSKVAKSVTE